MSGEFMSRQSLGRGLLQNFLGYSPRWYKLTVLGFLALNPLLFAIEPAIESAIRDRPRLWKFLNRRARVVAHEGRRETVRRLTTHAVTATAVPYYAWANRGAAPMRVWLPIAR